MKWEALHNQGLLSYESPNRLNTIPRALVACRSPAVGVIPTYCSAQTNELNTIPLLGSSPNRTPWVQVPLDFDHHDPLFGSTAAPASPPLFVRCRFNMSKSGVTPRDRSQVLQTRDQVLECVANPKLTLCPATQLPGNKQSKREGRGFFFACNKTCLFRPFGHCLQTSLVRKPSPCAPQRHLPWKASAFSLRINCDWPLQTPVRPYTFSCFWTHRAAYPLVRGTSKHSAMWTRS